MRYGGFWLRVIASIIDGILIQIVVFVGAFLVVMLVMGEGTEESLHIIANLVGLVISWLYYTLLESSNWQATIGKKALGLKVTDLQGQQIGFGRANARYWSKILSALILMIGFLMVAFTEKKQGLHDLIASTLVIKS
ncbi:MAG: RDD family protein [Candidatus Parabeggiatoa sp. nov. 3]|nr:MAG: RDD family protein [Gammaproteobacteria bacterium]RKZ66391.1 MAG: RDD family protein [Gammaproteobacteria bacterium]RKZ82469.1 MAG: RDD family protein [Gammaproteobacteria bacterium]